MSDPGSLKLKIVDGMKLSEHYRRALRPGDTVRDDEGRCFSLPRYLYEIDSWQTALTTELSPNFGLYEFISTDVREAPPLRGFPRYVPLAITHLAAHLSVFRQHLGTYVHIAANGGYRSPSHQISSAATPHHWATAVNIYRIGDDNLDSPELVRRYTGIVRRLLPGAWVRPHGTGEGETMDHLHFDLGRFVVAPREAGTCEDDTGGVGKDGGSGKEG